MVSESSSPDISSQRQVHSVVNFAHPPLDELVLGVQFTTPPNLRSTHFGALHNRFLSEYPIVEDQPKIGPQFETFGGNPQSTLSFQFGGNASLNRVWFVSRDDQHLVQFQDDRLLVNWRRRAVSDRYPRYENVSRSMEQALATVGAFFAEELSFPLQITQAEVSYINAIPLDSYSRASDWLKFFGAAPLNCETLNLIFTEIVNRDSRPVARMHYMVQSALMAGERKSPALRFDMTCRGAPRGVSVDAALEFMDFARSSIVNRFCEFTTDEAQAVWKREP